MLISHINIGFPQRMSDGLPMRPQAVDRI